MNPHTGEYPVVPAPIGQHTSIQLWLVIALVGLGVMWGAAQLQLRHQDSRQDKQETTLKENGDRIRQLEILVERMSGKMDRVADQVEDIHERTRGRRRVARDEP